MTSKRIAVGLLIDGLGLDDSKPGGTVFHWGNHAPTSSTYEWRSALIKPPRGGWSRLDVVRNRVTSNAVNFELELSDTVAEALQYTQTVADTTLASAIEPGDTSITLDAAISSNTVAHIGNEAILFGSGGPFYGTVTRGYYSSTAEHHEAGARVYLSISQWKYRPVSMIVHDLETGLETVLYRGMITEMPAPNLAVIRIQTRDILGPIQNVQSNQEAGDMGGGRANVAVGLVAAFDPDYGDSRILAESGSTLKLAFQMAEAVIYVEKDGDSVELRGNPNYRDSTGARYSTIRMGSRIDDDDLDLEDDPTRIFDDPIWEILVVDRAGDLANPTRKISSTQDLGTPYHPLAIALALLRSDGTYDPSTYRIFSEEVGCGLNYIDTSDWATQITNTPELNTFVDQLVLGWDGEAFRAFEVATRLIRAAGFLWSIAETGGLTVRRFETPSINTVQEGFDNAVKPYRESFPWNPNLQSTASQLFAVVGELPWREGDRVKITVPGESPRSARFESRRYDYEADMITRSKSGRVQRVLNSVALLLHQNVPTLGVRVPWSTISGVEYDLGAQVSLNDIPVESGWIVDASGTRIAPAASENDEAWIGTIIGRSVNFENMTVDLELALYAFADDGRYARLRAPAMRVQSASGADITGYSSSDFGATTTDAETFTVGDDVSLFYLDGSPVSEEVREIDSISIDGSGNGVLTLASAFTATPDTTMIVRPCESGSFSNSSLYSFTTRPYCYYSDENDEIGGSTGDPFGGGLGII